MTSESPIILKMQETLAFMIRHGAGLEAIELLKESIMHQILTEDVATHTGTGQQVITLGTRACWPGGHD